MEHRTRAGSCGRQPRSVVLDFDGVLAVTFQSRKIPPVARDAAASVGLASLVRASQLESVKRRAQGVRFFRP